MTWFTVNKITSHFSVTEPLPWCCHIWLQCSCCDSVAWGMWTMGPISGERYAVNTQYPVIGIVYIHLYSYNNRQKTREACECVCVSWDRLVYATCHTHYTCYCIVGNFRGYKFSQPKQAKIRVLEIFAVLIFTVSESGTQGLASGTAKSWANV